MNKIKVFLRIYKLRVIAGENMSKKYKIIKVLGKGAYGVTYLAIDNEKTRVTISDYVAIKSINIGDALRNNVNINQIFNEIDTLRDLSCEPNCNQYVACYIDSFRETYAGHDTFFIVMEYIDGVTLDQALYNALPDNDKIHIMITLAEGLAYIHSKGYAHRDIKPQNIMIVLDDKTSLRYPTAKIIDFGLSCSKLCNSNSGTPLWQPPEFYQYRPPNSLRSSQAHDIWSLGIVYYQMMNGSFPFKSNNIINENQLINSLLHEELIPSHSKYTYLNQLINEMLQKNWQARPTSYQVVNWLIQFIIPKNL